MKKGKKETRKIKRKKKEKEMKKGEKETGKIKRKKE